jgi:hypothetical protein
LRGIQIRGYVHYRHCKFQVYDVHPLLNSFKLGRLANCGELIGLPKLAKPSWLGVRGPSTNEERNYFEEYARRDAEITARIVAWLRREQQVDPTKIVSAGTLASQEFEYPRRLRLNPKDRRKKSVLLPNIEEKIWKATCAGRAETFYTDLTPDVYYSDCMSLYPLAIAATRALQIQNVEEVNFGVQEEEPPEENVENIQLEFSGPLTEYLKLTDQLTPQGRRKAPFGSVEGIFYVGPDHTTHWGGLPVRGPDRIYYVTGQVSGLFHTFDLAAAKAHIQWMSHLYRPVYSERQLPQEEKFDTMLLRRLNDEVTDVESRRIKAVLAASSGKFGQNKPAVVPTSNFLAYSTLIAYSHLIMAQLMEEYPAPILAMATDSIFGTADASGRHFMITDGTTQFPVRMTRKGCGPDKGKGDCVIFRSGMYILKNPDIPVEVGVNPIYGARSWHYDTSDFLRLFNGDVVELDTTVDVRRTLKTKSAEALTMPDGYWCTRKVKLTNEKIRELLAADTKRRRASLDSYQLVSERRNQPSEAWSMKDLRDKLPVGGH